MTARFSSRAVLSHFPPDNSRGFALLITITLVAFLVLILVGLASFTRVETSVADNAQSLAQARQNALTALNIAVGELQRAAGPDQRVTATADILTSTDATKGRWTGVWDSTDTAGPITWLVSRGDPDEIPDNTGAASAPDDNNIELVGAGSTDITVNSGLNRVVVPAQTITADVPGVGDGSTVGKFAWWVGDEGVKARVNLVDPFAPGGSFTPTSAQQQLRLTAAQRLGIENVRTITTDAGTVLGNAFPANEASVEKLFQLNQIRFLNSGAAALNTAPRRLFHDFTVHSAGVLSDVRLGGLRADFSYLLGQTNLNAFRTELGTHLSRSLSSNFNPIVSDLDGDGTRFFRFSSGKAASHLI
jgi:hypothetical protein